MFVGDINLYFILFFLVLFSVSFNVSNALHLLLTAELLWITLYIIVISVGFVFDNMNLLSLTFFFLVLSAVEFGIGLVIILLQNVFLRSTQLNDNSKN
jgi:NADH:ubiquinone oxidoreductase subunit K